MDGGEWEEMRVVRAEGGGVTAVMLIDRFPGFWRAEC